MSRYRVAVQIVPRQGLLDPQGKAVADALRMLGFGQVTEARIGRHILIELDADNAAGAGDAAREMCARLLANPVTEDFEIAGVSGAGT